MSTEQRPSNQMPNDVRERCRKLREASKRGQYIAPDDFAFLQSAYEQWPDEYNKIGDEAFKTTAPFGSQI